MNRVINYLSSFINYYYKVVSFDMLGQRDNFIYLNNSNSLFTGTAVSYYKNSIIKEKISFKNGLKHGKGNSYYKSGRIREKALFKNGLLNGTAILYAENGIAVAKLKYKNGELL